MLFLRVIAWYGAEKISLKKSCFYLYIRRKYVCDRAASGSLESGCADCRKKVPEIDEVYVATDDDRISSVCAKYSINSVMTASTHGTSTERVNEVAHKVDADLYIVINGDEPLIDPEIIRAIIPKSELNTDFYVSNLMTEILRPSEVVDFTNIKVVTDEDGNALFMSRSPIPYAIHELIEKGYKVCVQPVGTTNYDDESLIKLIKDNSYRSSYGYL